MVSSTSSNLLALSTRDEHGMNMNGIVFRMTLGAIFRWGWLGWLQRPGHPCRESGAACVAAPGVHARAATSPMNPTGRQKYLHLLNLARIPSRHENGSAQSTVALAASSSYVLSCHVHNCVTHHVASLYTPGLPQDMAGSLL